MEKAGLKKDARVTKSIKTILDATMTLLSKKAFEKIAVNDICQEALLSRSTFYSYFEDKYDLLRYALEALKSNFIAKGTAQGDLVKVTISEIYNQKALFKNLLVGEAKEELRRMLYSLIEEDIRRSYRQEHQSLASPEFDEFTLHYMPHFVVGNSFALLLVHDPVFLFFTGNDHFNSFH